MTALTTGAALSGENPGREKPFFLKHYTRRDRLDSILESGVLRLADPALWQDKNDQAGIRAFARLSGDRARQVRVLCLTAGNELIHHWNAYAAGPEGRRIELDTEAFLERAGRLGLIHGWVDYRRHDLKPASLPVDQLPFIKRAPYQSDREYRVLWAGPEGAQPPEIPIKGLIRSITLSGELPEAEAEAEKDRTAALAAAAGPGVKIHLSALWKYRQWINKFDSL
ncbi:MAG: hypothetical protein LBP80_10390 [Treponema sp.]|jgi:hypothetical protein|nr:hypothetical protein [Treponema sp.]